MGISAFGWGAAIAGSVLAIINLLLEEEYLAQASDASSLSHKTDLLSLATTAGELKTVGLITAGSGLALILLVELLRVPADGGY